MQPCNHPFKAIKVSPFPAIADTLAKLKKHSNSHIDFNFPHKEGSSLGKLIPHISPDCVDLITKLLAYDPDERISARQADKHPYFRDIRDVRGTYAPSTSLSPLASPLNPCTAHVLSQTHTHTHMSSHTNTQNTHTHTHSLTHPLTFPHLSAPRTPFHTLPHPPAPQAEKRVAAEKQSAAVPAPAADDDAAARAGFKASKGARGSKARGGEAQAHLAHPTQSHRPSESEGDAAGESSCLPNIRHGALSVGPSAGHGAHRSRAVRERAQRKTDDRSSDDDGGAPGGSCGGDDDDGGHSMLPRIGGGGRYGGGVVSLKIDSKSILGGQKPRAVGMQKLQPTGKKLGGLYPGGLGAGGLQGKPLIGGLQGGMHQLGLGAQLGSAQTRSLDTGAFGNSALGQPPFGALGALGALGLGHSGQPLVTGKKSYMSPYSQRKTKV